MANPLRKGWRYLSTKLSAGIDERADPRIQIQQAIEDAQQQHHRLIQQAAAVIGQQRQLQMRLSRQLEHVEQLQASARQALLLADSARSSGDERKAVEYEQAGQSFASQLVAAERAIEDLKALYDQAVLAATEARRAVEQNAMLLQHKLAERTRLLTQLEQAKLQEQVADSLQQMSDTAIPTATPSLAEVRDKIEARYARALGQAELARSTMSGRMLEVESAAMDMAGAARLAEIRASITSSLPGEAEAIEAPDSKT